MARELESLRGRAANDAAIEHGLRGFLLRVYLKGSGGLVMSAVIAWSIVTLSAPAHLLFVEVGGQVRLSPWGRALVFSPLPPLLISAYVRMDPAVRRAGLLYWSVAALVGASLSLIAFVNLGETLISAFLVTASVFAALALWGYLTRPSPNGLGNLLVGASFGLIIALALHRFSRNGLVEFVLDVVGVLIFSGLIAFDTQRLKQIYLEVDDPVQLGPASDYGALSLYRCIVEIIELPIRVLASRSRR